MIPSRVLSVAAIVLAWASCGFAQTTINGNTLAFQSNGEADGSGWTIGNQVVGNNGDPVNGVGNNSNGYVGTYVQVPTSGSQVSLTINASGIESGTTWPDMTVSVAGINQSLSVNSTNSGNYTATFNLPGDANTAGNGMYMVRIQLDNQTGTATPDLNVNSVTVNGASVVNSNTDAIALEAAQTYADDFRSGPASISLTGPLNTPLPAGTPVHVKLVSNAFNFADAVTGVTNSTDDGNAAWLPTNAAGSIVAPTPGSYAAEYQAADLANFNAIVPSNAGKWSSDEATQGSPNMSYVDQLTQFAQENGLQMRMHNLIWDTQQPTFVNNLFNTIAAGGSGAAAAKQTLSNDITSRINNYYLRQQNTLTNNTRASNYAELDVLNEAWHAASSGDPNDNYWKVYGASGIASIYNQVAAAVAAAGANTRLYLNEYNVLQFSQNPLNNGPSDPYANWYLAQNQDLRNAGGALGGVGLQYYVNSSGTGSNAHSPARIMEALQNLSVLGLPLSLTEFGASSGSTFTSSQAASIMTQTMTMMYGTPLATTMGFWGDLGGPNEQGPFSMYDSNWNLTAVGQAYQQWMSQWNTNLNLTTGADGLINFDGTYGLYQITVDGQTEYFNLSANQPSSVLEFTDVPEPGIGPAVIAAAGLLRRKRRGLRTED